MKKTPQVFAQGISVQNFGQIGPFLEAAPKFSNRHTDRHTDIVRF